MDTITIPTTLDETYHLVRTMPREQHDDLARAIAERDGRPFGRVASGIQAMWANIPEESAERCFAPWRDLPLGEALRVMNAMAAGTAW